MRPTKICSVCQKVKKLYKINPPVCSHCWFKAVAIPKLKILEKKFKSPSDYNLLIFQLYIKYLCCLNSPNQFISESIKFSAWLENNKLEKINSWAQIDFYTQQFKLFYSPNNLKGGPFPRVAFMLVRLGVLPVKHDLLMFQIEVQIKRFKKSTTKTMILFTDYLRKGRRSSLTIHQNLKCLANLEEWRDSQSHGADIFSMDLIAMEKYLYFLKVEKNCPSASMITFQYDIRRFYEWCKLNKLIITNPCPIPTIKRPERLCRICTEKQFQALLKYIKNKNTDPEIALVLYLILLMGLKSEDLKSAQLKIEDGMVTVLLKQKSLTVGQKFHNRKPQITLPQASWHLELQKRFIPFWIEKNRNSSNPFSIPLLLLPKMGPVRPCTQNKIFKLITKGTIDATGKSIPYSILRQTCAHLYSSKNDSSILSSLGWSRLVASNYAWRTRIFYKQK